jgi:hypothetical protein
MKILKIISILLLVSIFAHSQTWQWAKRLGGPCNTSPGNSERVNSIITNGTDYFVIGDYCEMLYLPSDTLYANGINDIFIAKFDAGGNQLWAKTIGGNFNQPSDFESAFGIFDTLSNCIYITGNFINTINFGGSIFLTSTPNNSDIFLAKMDLNGNFIWAKKGGGPGVDRSKVYINPYDKIYLVTQTSDSGYFDSYHLGPGGGIIQYDTSGACLSAQIKFTAPYFSNQNGVYIDFINTDLIIYGLYRTDTFRLDTAILINQGVSDAFLARADSNANVKWIKSFGNAGADAFYSLSIDNSHNLYMTGAFKDSINLGSGTITNNNGNDILIAKFDGIGNNIWTKQTAANGTVQSGYKILSDGDGNCYVTGQFSGSASFGTYNISTTNQYDMFLTRYNTSGDCLGVRQFGAAYGTCLAVDNSGDVVCGGPFINTINIGGNSFTAYQGYDIWLAKIDEFTGIGGEERIANNQLLIYANPNAGKCNITVPDDFLHEKNLTLSIYDNTGKLIQQKTLEMNDGKIKLNLEAEAKGVYNVTLSNGKKSYNGKIVFE